MYPGDDFESKSSKRFTAILIAVLALLLVVGTAVEISYYRELSQAMNGVERERDELRSENNMLRNMVLQKLEDHDRVLRELHENALVKKG
ncbi:TPA: hypothetical protein ACGQ50_000858 [Enterobacter cloacae]